MSCLQIETTAAILADSFQSIQIGFVGKFVVQWDDDEDDE
jgi:hypothetical protein